MAGSKRNKIKKALSPKSVYSPPPDNTNDEELLDDLVAQLDSRDGTVQHEAATVIQEVEQKANEQANSKKDSRSRFEARQVRICQLSSLAILLMRGRTWI
jgi:OTU domain-containing protein 6